MQLHLLAGVLVLLDLTISAAVQSSNCKLNYDYLDVYPDPACQDQTGVRTPLYFALIQSLPGPVSLIDGSGTIAGVRVALDRINNDTSMLPNYTLHYTLDNSQCNQEESLEAFDSQIHHEPKKLAILGSGCSLATVPTAEISHSYNITQISFVSSSSELSNRTRFPRYFQMLASMDELAIGYYGVIKEFEWERVAIIVHGVNLWTETMDSVKEMLETDNVEYSEKVFSVTSDGRADFGSNPFDENSRVFLLSMYPVHARQLLCLAYERDMFFPKYTLLILGRYGRNWWRRDSPPNLSCTADEREKVLLSMLAVSESPFLGVNDVKRTTTPGITAGEFLAEENKFIGDMIGTCTSQLKITPFEYSQYSHDATWTLAYALNKTLNDLKDEATNEAMAEAFNVTPPFRLENFSYSSDMLVNITFGHMSKTNFSGITGPINFVEGIRNFGNVAVFQHRNITANGNSSLELVRIGGVSPESRNFTYEEGEDQNKVNKGGVARKKIVGVRPALTTICVILACAGIVFAIVCLIFNFLYRDTKLMKLASTKLNYLIGIGAIILYIDIFFFAIPATNPDVAIVFCNLTPWLTAIGYSLCYGTILAKMARVYYISTSKKIVEDMVLIIGVAILVTIDMIILITYILVEDIHGNFEAHLVSHRERPVVEVEGDLGIVINNCVYICDSTARDIFLGILYGYKMALQVIALVLAFSIRTMKVKGLDDAKYTEAAIFVTTIVMAVIIVVTYSMKEMVNGFTALFCTGILVGTTVILILVFVPLMKGLYGDPKGENILKNTSEMSKLESESSETKMKRRIKELEDEVKELKELTIAPKQELEHIELQSTP